MTGKKGETPSNEELMHRGRTMDAEYGLQLPFTFSEAFQIFIYVLLFVGSWQYLGRRPNLAQVPPRSSALRFSPVQLGDWQPPLKLRGAWLLSSDDPRFGGVSGLAVEGGQLLALTDQGSVARFPKPGSRNPRISMAQLPDGPSNGRFTWNRDTEALARDPLGRGWWVTFEKANELWLYDLSFRRALKQIRLGKKRWPTNLGIEGLVAQPGPEISS